MESVIQTNILNLLPECVVIMILDFCDEEEVKNILVNVDYNTSETSQMLYDKIFTFGCHPLASLCDEYKKFLFYACNAFYFRDGVGVNKCEMKRLTDHYDYLDKELKKTEERYKLLKQSEDEDDYEGYKLQWYYSDIDDIRNQMYKLKSNINRLSVKTTSDTYDLLDDYDDSYNIDYEY